MVDDTKRRQRTPSQQCNFEVKWGKAKGSDQVQVIAANLEHNHPRHHCEESEPLTADVKQSVAVFARCAVPPGQSVRILKKMFPSH
mmetsp:Transcript_145424/g.253803  ORF Transcript_145424/g.253803 Transcript_145424/m.253803 type:complete len:86 (+) Transcript_145424:197-454(+)